MNTAREIKSHLFGESPWGWLPFLLLLALMAAYPIYTNVQFGEGYSQYSRQIEWLEERSHFFNPWQYRALMPLIVEGIYFLYSHTIDKILPASILFPADNPEVIRYYIVFSIIRIALHIAVFFGVYVYLGLFIRSLNIRLAGVFLVFLAFGNAVMDSDLSMNTYLDLLFFLLAALVYWRQLSAWYIVPISILAALNRETALLIPVAYAMSFIRFRPFALPPLRVILISLLSFVCIVGILLGIRSYFGYVDPELQNQNAAWYTYAAGIAKVLFELFGIVFFLPFFIPAAWKSIPLSLKIQAIPLFAVWMAVHLPLPYCWEVRVFLVPMLLVILPMGLIGLEKVLSAKK